MRGFFASTLLLLALPLCAQQSSVAIARAQEALDADRPEAAVALLEAAIKQSPRDANAHYLLGVACGTIAEKSNVLRQVALAHRTLHELETAVRLDPNHLDARLALVEYYTLAPAFLGGSKQKALAEVAEIRRRDATLGERAMAMAQAKSPDELDR